MVNVITLEVLVIILVGKIKLMDNVLDNFQNNFNHVQSLKMLIFHCTGTNMNLKGALQAQKISMDKQT